MVCLYDSSENLPNSIIMLEIQQGFSTSFVSSCSPLLPFCHTCYHCSPTIYISPSKMSFFWPRSLWIIKINQLFSDLIIVAHRLLVPKSLMTLTWPNVLAPFISGLYSITKYLRWSQGAVTDNFLESNLRLLIAALPEKPKLLEIVRNDLCSYSGSDIPRVSYFNSI